LRDATFQDQLAVSVMAIASRPLPIATELRIAVQAREQIVNGYYDGIVSTKMLVERLFQGIGHGLVPPSNGIWQ
jgi:hypothetical protein